MALTLRQNKLVRLCDDIITQGSEKTDAFCKACSLTLVRVKTLNREAQLNLDAERKELESKKGNLDQLRQQLENLRYKEAYLSREIKECKNLFVPNLADIEKENKISLGTTVFSDQLQAINSSTILELTDELNERIATQKSLRELEMKSKQIIEKVDRKRKFLDELPAKCEAIKESTLTLKTQFESIITTDDITTADSS
jgi:chromosome segregation ATPase